MKQKPMPALISVLASGARPSSELRNRNEVPWGEYCICRISLIPSSRKTATAPMFRRRSCSSESDEPPAVVPSPHVRGLQFDVLQAAQRRTQVQYGGCIDGSVRHRIRWPQQLRPTTGQGKPRPQEPRCSRAIRDGVSTRPAHTGRAGPARRQPHLQKGPSRYPWRARSDTHSSGVPGGTDGRRKRHHRE